MKKIYVCKYGSSDTSFLSYVPLEKGSTEEVQCLYLYCKVPCARPSDA
jgi:hypothetical protein